MEESVKEYVGVVGVVGGFFGGFSFRKKFLCKNFFVQHDFFSGDQY